MAERETADERRLETARMQADVAAHNISEISALNAQGNTVLMSRNMDAATIDSSNHIISLFHNGVPIPLGEDGRFSRDVLDNFLRDNHALANAFDAMNASAPTYTLSGRPIDREIDYDNSRSGR